MYSFVFECRFDLAKLELNDLRKESEVCRPRYPILLVHGIFFRDWQLVNYWGRIPKELTRNGAVVYCGGQQSAAAVAQSGAELRIGWVSATTPSSSALVTPPPTSSPESPTCVRPVRPIQ